VPTLDLAFIAARLEGLEETIIHRLIDRAQFAANGPAYEPGKSGFENAAGKSLFDLRLRFQEEMDAAFGRFSVPEERPYHRDLPSSQRNAQLREDSVLHTADLDDVNLTPDICRRYLAHLPLLCVDTDDGHYGSSVEHDVLAIQAIARRIHYGSLYVAESKYQAAPDQIQGWIDAGNREAILQAITRPEVENRILRRVAEKVDYIQATINTSIRRRIAPETVLELYRDTIIPLTKEGELRYLFARTQEVE
jgi:chorismate mutase